MKGVFLKMIIKTLFCAVMMLFITHNALASKDEQQLSQLKNVIAEQQKTVNRQQKQYSSLQGELKTQEKKISNVNVQLTKNQKQFNTLDAEIKVLSNKIIELEKQQKQHKQVLANQIEQAFRLGPVSELELIFNGTESERNERMITYLKYINQEREKTLNELNATQDALQDNRKEVRKKATEQTALIEKNKKEKTRLAQYKKDREKTLKALNVTLSKSQQRLTSLIKNEADLQKKIDKARKAAQEKLAREAKKADAIRRRQQTSSYNPTPDEIALMARASGLGKAEKKYTRPVVGKVLHRFGEQLQGELYWKGIVIAANEGTPVKAIADGTVLLASWLQGYGFMVVIGHGRSDMSLYGYNQQVSVKVDDKIRAGQTIALTGNTGGQEQPALYFEIRRDGHALDPERWLR